METRAEDQAREFESELRRVVGEGQESARQLQEGYEKQVQQLGEKISELRD